MKMARNTLWYLLATFFQQAPLYLLLPWWSRHLSRADFGVTGTLQVYGWVFGHLLAAGLPQAAYRFHFDRRADADAAARQVRALLLAQTAWAAAAGALIWATGGLWWPQVSGGHIAWAGAGALAVLVAVGESWSQLPLLLCQAAERARLCAVIQLGRGLLLTALLAALVVVRPGGAAGWMTALAACSALTGAALVAGTLARLPGRGIDASVLPAALRYGLPLVPHQLAMWVLHGIGRVVVERHCGIEEAGRFNFASQLALAAYVLILGLGQAWTPLYYGQAKAGRGEAWLTRSLGWYWAAGGALACAGVLLVEPLLRLFPAHLHDAAPLVGPLLVGMLAFGGYTLYAAPLAYHHRTHLTPWITAAAALASAAGQFMLVPRLGPAAAAWTTGLTLVLLCAGFALAARLATGLRPRAALAAASLAAPAALVLLLRGAA